MNIEATNHAIKRYRERLFDYTSSNKTIVSNLKEIAMLGQMVRHKPNDCENCFEIKHKGISIVIIDETDNRVILTCLGEDTYRKWVKSKGIPSKISQRILFGCSNTIPKY